MQHAAAHPCPLARAWPLLPPQVHPMRPGATVMSSFLFNIALILLATTAVIQFCAEAFAEYADGTDILKIFGNQVGAGGAARSVPRRALPASLPDGAELETALCRLAPSALLTRRCACRRPPRQLTYIRGIKYIYTENIFIYCWLGFIGESAPACRPRAAALCGSTAWAAQGWRGGLDLATPLTGLPCVPLRAGLTLIYLMIKGPDAWKRRKVRRWDGVGRGRCPRGGGQPQPAIACMLPRQPTKPACCCCLAGGGRVRNVSWRGRCTAGDWAPGPVPPRPHYVHFPGGGCCPL